MFISKSVSIGYYICVKINLQKFDRQLAKNVLDLISKMILPHGHYHPRIQTHSLMQTSHTGWMGESLKKIKYWAHVG